MIYRWLGIGVNPFHSLESFRRAGIVLTTPRWHHVKNGAICSNQLGHQRITVVIDYIPMTLMFYSTTIAYGKRMLTLNKTVPDDGMPTTIAAADETPCSPLSKADA